MRQRRSFFQLCFGCAVVAGLANLLTVAAATAAEETVIVVLDTSAGPITLELDQAKAPATVDNFLKYVDSGFFNNLVFHRVIDGFMIQGGGFEDKGNMLRQKTEGSLDPIKNEAANGLKNVRGTIAMARTADPNSATSQFFINLVDNRNTLDRSAGSAGYAVFGKVTEGIETVDKIARAATGSKRDADGQLYKDVPTKPIVIRSAKRKAKS